MEDNTQKANDRENAMISLFALSDKGQLIEQWTKLQKEDRSSTKCITRASIYTSRKKLLELLPGLRDRFARNNTIGRSYLEDSILILRRDFGETFRNIFSLDNHSEEELKEKRRGVRRLKNLYLEAEDCILSAIETDNQISVEEIKDIIENLGKLSLGLDKWAKSL